MLSVFLLSLGDALRHVLHRGLVLEVESERLAFESGFVNQHTGVGLETGEGRHDVVVDLHDFADASWVLEISDSLLFNSKDDGIGALDSNGGSAFVDGLEGVLDLEELAVWGEDGDGFVVGWHDFNS